MGNPSINKTAVIVLNWNGTEDTILCVDSLTRQTVTDFDIIVVDNGSDRDSVARLDQFIADSAWPIIYLKNQRNLGFAGGVNTGIRYALDAGYEAVALLNNDAVADPGWLAALSAELTQSDVAIVTGALLRENGETTDSTGELYSVWGLPFPNNRDKPVAQLPEAGFIFGATGGATLYRTSLFKEIGLFDERFFAYYEDVDISFRAQLTGHRVYFTAAAVALHKQGASSKKIPGFTVYQVFKNLPMVYLKNVPAGLLPFISPRFHLAYFLIFWNAVFHGTGTPALKGFIQSLILIPHSLYERRRIQTAKTVSTEYILSSLYPDLPPEQVRLRRLRKFFTGKP